MREVDVRRSLHGHLADQHQEDPDTLVIDELAVGNGRRRVDVAVVNGELTGYEIKSQADTLERLPGQMDLYNRVFDRMWLVASPSHLAAATASIPAWWGVQEAVMEPNGVQVTVARSAGLNGEQEARSIAQLLWREEALMLLDEFSIGTVKLRRGSRRHMYDALAVELPLDELKRRVRLALKSREGWR